MSGCIPKTQIVKACLNGVHKARDEYYSMSGYSLFWAPEYFITTHIAQALHHIDGTKYITIESNIHESLGSANAIGQGRLNGDLNLKGRFDLVLWWAKDKPRVVIEVKNRVRTKQQCEKDLKRIAAVVNRKKDESSIKFGLFVFYIEIDSPDSGSAASKVLKKASRIEEMAKDLVGNKCNVTLARADPIDEKGSYSLACCLQIERI